MRNVLVFIGWTLLLVVLAMTALSFYVISQSDGTATYAQMGYDTGRYFFPILLLSIVLVAIGKSRSFLPGFSRPKQDSRSAAEKQL